MTLSKASDLIELRPLLTLFFLQIYLFSWGQNSLHTFENLPADSVCFYTVHNSDTSYVHYDSIRFDIQSFRFFKEAYYSQGSRAFLLLEGSFQDGVRVGNWKWYNEPGQIKEYDESARWVEVSSTYYTDSVVYRTLFEKTVLRTNLENGDIKGIIRPPGLSSKRFIWTKDGLNFYDSNEDDLLYGHLEFLESEIQLIESRLKITLRPT